jgi:hypothetical protein
VLLLPLFNPNGGFYVEIFCAHNRRRGYLRLGGDADSSPNVSPVSISTVRSKGLLDMKKTDVKIVLLSAAGVALAGLVMAQFPEAPGIAQARDGYRS